MYGNMPLWLSRSFSPLLSGWSRKQVYLEKSESIAVGDQNKHANTAISEEMPPSVSYYTFETSAKQIYVGDLTLFIVAYPPCSSSQVISFAKSDKQ